MTQISGDAVHDLFIKCLWEHEPPDPVSTSIVVEGVLGMKVGFDPAKITEHEPEIVDFLSQLPPQFLTGPGGGGGWSFLNACNDKNDNQWTGLHRTMDELFLLGQAIGKVQYLMPREMWPILPGGMPYMQVDLPVS
jgi:hypothetical protein